jgi:hypothetical protein
MLKKRYRSAKQIDGVIDLERLRSGPERCIERKPDQFLELTYPSEDIHSMLRALSMRFGDNQPDGNGIILAEAVKGLGKSHALLTAYHLFANKEASTRWMQSIGYKWKPPNDPCIIIKKFTDEYLPFDSLWSVVDQEIKGGWTPKRPPSLDELRTALGNRFLILIFDELERGLSNIVDSAKRSQNLTFLQMVSEEANRSNQITLFAAIYDGSVEPGATLRRITPRIELRFRNPEDRAAIVRHRLFSNADSYDRVAADALIRSYRNAWKQHGVEIPEEYLSRCRKTFPFLPDLIELIFERISGSGGFQGTRGALGLLAAMVDANRSEAYLLTGGHCKITDKACANRLQDLDPAGNLINCAQRNFQDLKSQPFSEPLASAVLLASLIPGSKGLTREELVRHVAVPGGDPNGFEITLQAFRTFGSHFHEREGRLFFDLEENENAKVEIEARNTSDEKAREEIVTIWKQDIFKETHQSVVFGDPERTRNALDQLPKNDLRFVLASRRLSPVERHGLYFGSEMRNQIILLEPRDETGSLLTNPDIIASAKRSMAAANLMPSAGSAERRNRYERISQQERKNVRAFIKSAGLAYVRVETWSEKPEETVFEVEHLGQAADKQSVRDYLKRQYYPTPLLMEHIQENLDGLYGKTISQVERIYKNTLGYPVPIMVPDVTEAIIYLEQDGQRILGLQHPRRNFCGEKVTLGIGELPQAILARPWPASPRPPKPDAAQPEPPWSRPEPPRVPRPEGGVPSSPIPHEERSTAYCRSVGELRQNVAERLSDVEGNRIQGVRFQIFVRYTNVDLSSLPTALRGSIKEAGDLEAQVDLNIRRPMDKASVESLCESLPNLENGRYMAGIRLSAIEGQDEESEE